jgi:hypothetical protein
VAGVFVNYRTGDGDWAGLVIARELTTRFGSDRVFYASRTIRIGEDFAQRIQRYLADADVLLAVIGRRWLISGQLDDPQDWVRREIVLALSNDVRVVPVLLDGVQCPREQDLPDDMRKLARCQYLRLHHRNDDRDIARLVEELADLVPDLATSAPPVGNRRSARTVPPHLGVTVSEFASDVRRQLEHEQRINRVYDPVPITLHWSPPEARGLVDDLANMDEHFRVVGGLTTIEAIADRFLAAPSGRLIFLGHGGAGKSTLVARFALELLERYQEGDPVPVVVNLASWRHDTVMETWLAEQLIQAFPNLKNKTKRIDGKKTLASQLVEDNCLLPILDGFDEIPPPVRAKAIPTLNAALGRQAKVVMTSRPEEYTDVVTSEGGHVLDRAQVVELDPLTLDEVAGYLPRPRTGRGHQRTTKWDPVTSFLQEGPPEDPHRRMLQDVFTTPFMVMLARATYSDSDADPAELLDQVLFPDADAVRRHLLDAFVPARFTYSPLPEHAGRSKQWEPADAQRWLGFLAAFMSRQDKGPTEFAWWKAGAKLVGGPLFAATVLLAVPALALMIMFAVYGLSPFLVPGILLGVVLFVLMSAASGMYAEPMELSWKAVRRWLETFNTDRTQSHYLWVSLRLENKFYLALMIVGIMAPLSGVNSSVVVAPAMLGLFVLSPVMLMATQYGPTDVVSPPGLLRRDRRAALARVVFYGIVTVSFAVLTLIVDSNVNPFIWLFMLPVVGVMLLLASASGAWLACCVLLSSRSRLPLRLMSFLEEAHRRGVLRQAGGVYQFRHAFLQERLATQFQKSGGRLP